MGRGGRVIADALTRRYCSKTIMAESGKTFRAFSSSSSSSLKALSSSSFRLFHEPKPIQSVLRSCSSLSKASPQAGVSEEKRLAAIEFCVIGMKRPPPIGSAIKRNYPNGMKDYVVYMGSNKGGTEEGLKKKYLEMLSSVIPSEERERKSSFISMRCLLKGFMALLTEQEAAKLSGHPEVISVFPDYEEIYFPATPQGAEFGPGSVTTTSEYDDFVIDLIGTDC